MIPDREKVLRQRIHEVTSSDNRDGLDGQQIHQSIYGKTGMLAKEFFTRDDLEYLYHRLPKTTLTMLRLCGRNHPEYISMYDLRHSLISTQGVDAAMKIVQAHRVAEYASLKIRANPSRVIRILELGSGLSDVSAMVHSLIFQNLAQHLPSNKIQSRFEIVNVEYESHTMTLATEYMKEKKNIRVVQGDATQLSDFPDDTFDIVFTSLMLGAFDPPERAGLVLDEARRVARHGGRVIHADFVFLYGNSSAPWSRGKERVNLFSPLRMDSVSLFCGFDGLVRADHHLTKKIPKFFHELNQKITTSEFQYWSWFDAGDYAAWYISEKTSEYTDVVEERYCGAVPSAFRAIQALWKLMFYNWKEMDTDELEAVLSHCKQAGTAFSMTTATVNK